MLSEGGLLVQPTELARPGSPEAEAVAAEQHSCAGSSSTTAWSARASATNRPYLSPDDPGPRR